jgi:hypothetical protein
MVNIEVDYKNLKSYQVEILWILEEKVYNLESLDKNSDEFIPKLIIYSVKVDIYKKRQDIALEIKKVMTQQKLIQLVV